MKRVKKFISLIVLFLALVFLSGAYFCRWPFWQNVLIGLSTNFLSLSFAIIVVNLYLDKKSRTGAVGALVLLSHESIAKFHNDWLNIILSRFSKEEYGGLMKSFKAASGDILHISPDKRKWIYDLVVSNKVQIDINMDSLDKSLSDIISLVGWDLDAELLGTCLNTRNSIRLYRNTPTDGSDIAIQKIAKHMFDIELFSQTARKILLVLAEVDGA